MTHPTFQSRAETALAFKMRVLRYMVAAAFNEWRVSIWTQDIDRQYCCDGRECCCGGETIREMWSWSLNARRVTAAHAHLED